ncbi:tetrapac protein [Neisseria zoodegmatis]|uniref:Tetrapac protein n=1 Tax=Neisseria zoodegmatis TaxID=326523 RepID=A0A378WEG3_9NEIS|nr:SPOR domain-containing protein [Neisseria zoodegmatis]SUA35838.1 tetrapac protein [Neisseria zoodegmatis]
MANNRFQSLNEYEQLKRKNRRRLVGASALVIVAGFILARVLSQSNEGAEAENITIKAASSVQTASPEQTQSVIQPNRAASSDDASDLSPAAVLEPAPESGTESVELDNPLTAPAATEAETAPQPVLEPAPAPSAETAAAATATAKQQAAAKPETKPETPSEKTVKESAKPAPAPVSKPAKTEAPKAEADNAPPPVVIINNRVEPDAQAEAARKAAEQKAAQQKAAQAAQKAKAEAAAKEAEREKAAHQAKQEAGRLKAQQQAKAKAEAEKRAAQAEQKKQQEANRKAAQDALANKSSHPAEKSDPKAILEGKTNTKAMIQIGAYSSRRQAQQMQQKLADAGVSTYVSETETSKGKVYRVRTGSYPNREAAAKALEKIRQKGADGMVIGQQ